MTVEGTSTGSGVEAGRLPLEAEDERAQPRLGRRSGPPGGADCQSDRGGLVLFAGHLLTVWGLTLSSVLLVLTVLWTWFRRGLPLGRPAEWSPSALRHLSPLVPYVVLLLASIAVSYNPAASSSELSEIFTLATMPLALLWVRSEKRVRRLMNLVLGMVVLLAAHGLWQFFFTDYGPLNRRIPGLFSHYMTFSGILVLGICMALSRVITREGRAKARYWLALAILGGTLYLTLTRHAWLAALLAVALAMWIGARRLAVAYLASLLLMLALITTLSPGGGARLRSIFDLGNPSNYDRVCMAYAGMIMISERPLLGIGPAMVEERYPIYRHPTAPRKHVKHLHNTFVHLAAERGLLSVLAYLWLMGSVFATALRRYREEGGWRGPRSDLYIAVLLAIAVFNFSGLFEANWRDTEVQRLVLFLLAVPACLPPLRRGSP